MRTVCKLVFSLALLWSGSTHASSPIAFVDVNVVPMDQRRVLRHQTVLVRDTAISQVGPVEEVAIPSDAQRVEGNGTSYLVPGLADMHVHVSEADDLALFVANGVTTVLHMGGDPVAAVGTISRDLETGPVVSPRMFFAFKVDGGGQALSVTTPEVARSAVQLAKANGYDFIKMYNELSPTVFAAIVAEASERGMAIIGHGVRAVGLPKALFEGQAMVAHAEEFFYTAFANRTDRDLIPGVAAETLRSGAYVTPTLATYEAILKQWGRSEEVRQYLRDRRAKYMTPNVRADWLNAGYATATRQANTDDPVLAFLREFTKELHDKGVPLLTGTDSPVVPGMYPGYSVHDELRALVEAGLTPYDALSAATRVPGEFIAKTVPSAQRFGNVAHGFRADLVLVEGNPLSSLDALKNPLGVMRAGRWFTRAQLTTVLEDRKGKYEMAR